MLPFNILTFMICKIMYISSTISCIYTYIRCMHTWYIYIMYTYLFRYIYIHTCFLYTSNVSIICSGPMSWEFDSWNFLPGRRSTIPSISGFLRSLRLPSGGGAAAQSLSHFTPGKFSTFPGNGSSKCSWFDVDLICTYAYVHIIDHYITDIHRYSIHE